MAAAAALTVLMLRSSTASTRPNVLLVVVDDLGSNDLGFQSHELLTPNVDQLAHEGIVLTDYYVLPVCSPTRTSLLSGMYPMRFGLQHQVIWPGTKAGLPTNITTIADHFRSAGWATHAIGKWHAGFYSWEHTPTFRGFDSYLGYYGGGESYFGHTSGAGSEAPGPKLSSGYDFRLDEGRRCGAGCSRVLHDLNGSTCPAFATSNKCIRKYSTIVFTERAVAVIARHSATVTGPMFMYLAFQAVHAPDQVPQRYKEPYVGRVFDKKRITFGGMLSAADEGIGNVTRALSTHGMDTHLITVITTDNGGPSDQGPNTTCPPMSYCTGTGTSNWPKRGGKHTLWEGGVRGVAIIHSRSLLPASKRGTNYTHLMHVSDWLPTLLAACSLKPPTLRANLDGVSQWHALTGNGHGGNLLDKPIPPPRTEVLVFWDPLSITFDGQTGDAPKAAIRVGDYKLIVGPPGCPSSKIPAYRSIAGSPRNGTSNHGRGVHALITPTDDPPSTAGDCVRDSADSIRLYNVRADEGEDFELSATKPALTGQLRERISALVRQMPQPDYPDNDPRADPARHGGMWSPWVASGAAPENDGGLL